MLSRDGESEQLSDGNGGRRVCLFAGAGGLLGTAFCARFSEEYDIAAIYRRRRPQVPAQDFFPVDPLDPNASNGGVRSVFAIHGDISTQDGCDRIVDATLSRFNRIDLLVNAAVAPTWAPMLGTERLLNNAQEQMMTNVIAPLRLSTAVARAFWQGRDLDNRSFNRNVVNVSSVAGLRIYAGFGQSLYAASKAALNQLTGHMADEFTSIGVRVNATAPNSFPALVSVDRAASAIKTLDDGTSNSTIVVVDGEEDEVIQLSPFNAPARH
jgi:NAD(P)-dependent dehydrogenase (short-subunit alcohol dehydrogenase family)